MARISFTLSPDFKSLIEAWCEVEGITPAAFIRRLVAERLEWTLTEEDEPPRQPRRRDPTERKRQNNNKRAEAVQNAIDIARARLERTTQHSNNPG